MEPSPRREPSRIRVNPFWTGHSVCRKVTAAKVHDVDVMLYDKHSRIGLLRSQTYVVRAYDVNFGDVRVRCN